MEMHDETSDPIRLTKWSNRLTAFSESLFPAGCYSGIRLATDWFSTRSLKKASTHPAILTTNRVWRQINALSDFFPAPFATVHIVRVPISGRAVSGHAVMESTLHRELKLLYSGSIDDVEVQVDGYRIDAVVGGTLYEIQQASLGALREKVRSLLVRYPVVVVKPLASRKLLIRRAKQQGPVISSRFSPLRETVFHLFEDLVYFVDLFPHPRLTLEVVLTEQEEHRITKVRRRRFGPDYRVEDRRLVQVVSTHTLRTLADLRALLPATLISPFTTEDLAREARIPRWIAQKMAYCLRKTGAVNVLGKKGRAVLYELPAPEKPKRRQRRAA